MNGGNHSDIEMELHLLEQVRKGSAHRKDFLQVFEPDLITAGERAANEVDVRDIDECSSVYLAELIGRKLGGKFLDGFFNDEFPVPGFHYRVFFCSLEVIDFVD